MSDSIKIAKRFCGPPNSGNGGYVCGMLDNELNYISEVTLRKPPPLEIELNFDREADLLKLSNREELIATAQPGHVDFVAPEPPTFEEANNFAKQFVAQEERHFFPTCFVCGPDRQNGDGLEIFAGHIENKGIVAAPWVPDHSLVDNHGNVKNEFVWAALDCPGAFAIMGNQIKKLVLGRMTLESRYPIKQGEQCVVVGWKTGSDAPKYYSGTALYNAKQELCAVAKSTWFEID